MMGKINKQTSFDDIGWREQIPKDSFWWKLHDWAIENLCEEDYRGLFSEIGRPSISPIHTLLGILIQLEMGYSDRELEEESRFDERVKLALLAGRNFPGIDAVTLCDHRQLFFSSGMAECLLEKTLGLARTEGLLSSETRCIVDSFMISGAAAVQDTYTLIKAGIIKTLFIAKCHGLDTGVPQLERTDYDTSGKPRINWDNLSEKQHLLTALVHDALTVVTHFETMEGDLPHELSTMVARLRIVATQDVKIEGDTVEMVRGTAKDRVISVVDPEMRHGRKTSAKKSNGYKGHVIVGGEKGELVVAVDVTPANSPDAEPVPSMLADLDQKGRRPAELQGDSAYSSPELKAEQETKGTVITAKVAPSSNRKGLYNKDDFAIDLETRTVTCPAGNIVEIPEAYLTNRKGGTVSYDADICNACPLKDACTSCNNGRSVAIHAYEKERLEAKAFQQTDEFKQEYAYRSHVERKISHLTRHGARVARYIGLLKNKAQSQMVAATNNIKVIIQRRKTGELCLNASK